MIKRIPVLIFASLLLFTGCSKEQSQDLSINVANEQEYNQDNDLETEELEDDKNLDNQEDDKDLDNQEEAVDNDENTIEETNEKVAVNNVSNFKIYTSNDESDEIIEVAVDSLDEKNNIKYNLQELSNMLIKEHFKDDSIKINIVSIDENNIATIDLLNEEGWSKYFQGSTGGMLTQEVLTETLLQEDYDGEWVSGIKILVDGKENMEYDHISFVEVFDR